MNLNNLRKLNRHIRIRGITNLSFKKYGRIVTGYDFTEMIKYLEEKTPIPEEGCVYVSSVNTLEQLECARKIQDSFFGETSIQTGYCNGINSRLNYLEYHKSNEVLVAATDMVIFLGKVQDISNDHYEVKKAEAYFVPEGVALELYSSTLHSVPCRLEQGGFRCLEINLKGTGTALRNGISGEGPVQKNKWIIAHSSYDLDIDGGRFYNLLGENIEIIITS